MGYTKNIAVIRGLKSGFSADGGTLSGIVKAEKYGNSLKVEVSLINFAPLTEGKYVAAISDGKNVCVLDGLTFDGKSEVDTGRGFATLICFVNKTVLPIAAAICGGYQSAIAGIKQEIERQEKVISAPRGPEKKREEPIKYDDEAIAKENYYEYEQTDKDRGTVLENPEKEEDGRDLRQNEEVVNTYEELAGGLASGECFYDRMKDEIEKVLSDYPEERSLEETVENSRWVRINYGGEKYYIFGVIYGEDKPKYICYGVPTTDSKRPPESLAHLATFIPSSPEEENTGYWVTYQDANTGASIKIKTT